MSDPDPTTGLRRLTVQDVHEVLGPPDAPVKGKIDHELGFTARRFIAHSPFACLATSGPHGADCSPRGDGPGFVKVLSPTTLSLPDRTGNNLADSFRNVLANPQIGMLFLIPGMRESLRVNGTAFVTDDLDLRRRHEADGRVPKLVLVVQVRENYFHCGKSLIRSGIWDPATYIDPAYVVFDSNVFSLRGTEKGAVEITSAGLNQVLAKSYVTQL